MILLAVFGPALISVMIRKRQKKYSELSGLIIGYGVYALVIALITQSFIIYVLGMDNVTQEALESFSFFTKYVIFASVFAIIIPFLQLLVEKYISISVEVGVYDEAKENEEKSSN